MEDESLGIDWAEIEEQAAQADARRRGVMILKNLYTMESDEFSKWLVGISEDEHFEMILQLLSISEFLLESASDSIGTTGDMMIQALADLAENW